MLNIKELLTSKKFKVFMFSELGIVCSALADKVTWDQALPAMLALVVAYLGAQGLADIGKGK